MADTTEIAANSVKDIGNRGITNDILARFRGKARQCVVNIDDGYRPVVMDGETLGGKFMSASVDELNAVKEAVVADALSKTEAANTYLTKTDAANTYLDSEDKTELLNKIATSAGGTDAAEMCEQLIGFHNGLTGSALDYRDYLDHSASEYLDAFYKFSEGYNS